MTLEAVLHDAGVQLDAALTEHRDAVYLELIAGGGVPADIDVFLQRQEAIDRICVVEQLARLCVTLVAPRYTRTAFS